MGGELYKGRVQYSAPASSGSDACSRIAIASLYREAASSGSSLIFPVYIIMSHTS
ncbi:MAG: hypothetical protein P9M00_09120 [Candidatus Tritonobacter lacicola]|nr:hypothetical protein [Candidatus Tritonobacter lacicola]